MRHVKLNKYQDQVSVSLPEPVQATPSMMSPEERQLLFGLARDRYRGEGFIIDAGAFLGASTMCFGSGLAANARVNDIVSRLDRPIITYERGVISDNMQPTLRRHGVDLPTDGSFAGALENNIASVRQYVNLLIGDIMTSQWGDAPIEILYLDILKTPNIQDYVCATFFPSLQVGSIVLQQDYLIDGSVHIKLKQEWLADYFDYVGEIASMAIFEITKPIPLEVAKFDVRHNASAAEQFRLIDQAKQRTEDENRQFLIDLCKVRHMITLRQTDEARRVYEEVQRTYPRHMSAAAPGPRIPWRTRLDTAIAQVEKAFGHPEKPLAFGQ